MKSQSTESEFYQIIAGMAESSSQVEALGGIATYNEEWVKMKEVGNLT